MRQAYTLMEMLLVMALIVIMTAVSIPVMQTMLTDSRLTAAGDAVRARLADTRGKAMEEGRPWRLAFIANTGVYQYAPEDSTEWDQVHQELVDKDDQVRDKLPDEIIFAANGEDISGHKEASTPGVKWETIAIYVPDGSARDDTMTYFGKPGLIPMRMRLRSLTGAVTLETPIMVKGDS